MDDIEKLEIKKYERLYDLTLKGLDHEIERYRKLDTKIHYYVTILAILFGISTTLVPKFLEIVVDLNSFLAYIFFATFGLMYFADLTSLVLLVLALKLDNIYAYPVKSDTLNYFDNQNYVDVLYRNSESMLEAILYDRKRLRRKLIRLIGDLDF